MLIVHDEIVQKLQTCYQKPFVQGDDLLPALLISLICLAIKSSCSNSDTDFYELQDLLIKPLLCGKVLRLFRGSQEVASNGAKVV